MFNCLIGCTVKSCNYESRNNELSGYKEGRGDNAVMQVSIEKSRYNELSRNNKVKVADFVITRFHCIN